MGFDNAYLKQYVPEDYTTFIETGSHYGDTISRALIKFKEIHSIELCDQYYNYCIERFKEFKDRVFLYHGDSAELLPQVTGKLKDKKCLVYLDAHYSCETISSLISQGLNEMVDHHQCPIREELEALKVFNYPPIIIIDNLEMFKFDNIGADNQSRIKREDWPSVSYIQEAISSTFLDYHIELVPYLRPLEDPGLLPPNREMQSCGDQILALPKRLL